MCFGQRRIAGHRCRTYDHEKCGHQIVLGSPSEEVIIDSTNRAADEKNRLDSRRKPVFIRAMQLRDHPLMIRKSGYPAWPPRWTTTRLSKNDKPLAEIGSLEQVLMTDWFNNKIFLFIRYRGNRYMGLMAFDDPAFCYQIFTLLKSKLGCSIKEIGDLDLSAML
jgi:hypothetical protein